MSQHFHIEFVGHACMKITAGRLRIATDPWIDGPAYTRQWYLYPLPDRSVRLDDVQYVHYSHGHEDHLHQPSFHLLPKNATVLLTRQWFPGNVEWLRSEGFEYVREVASGRWIRLTDPASGDSVQCVNVVNRSDSLSILTTEKEVLVNVNDALHCYDTPCIDFYCRRIQALLKGRPIEYLFCGFGGASYFPNCLRHPGKDDGYVGAARERHLAQGFARVVRNLQPRMAFAFAANLVLLDPAHHWINEIKFQNDPVTLTEHEMEAMRGRVFKLVPGDTISRGELRRKDADRTAEEHIAGYQRLYAREIAAKKAWPALSVEAADEVLGKLGDNVRGRLKRVGSGGLPFDWAVRLRDCLEAVLRVTQNGTLRVERISAERLPEVRDMVIEANSDVLLAGLESTWGGDSLQIGYGALFHLRSDESVKRNHSRHFLRLATKLPLQSDYLRLSPRRGIEHLLRSPYLMREALKAFTFNAERRRNLDSAGRAEAIETSRWIDAPKCAGCPVCDVPAERCEP